MFPNKDNIALSHPSYLAIDHPLFPYLPTLNAGQLISKKLLSATASNYLTWDYYGGIYYGGIYYGGDKYGGFFQKPPN